MKVLRLKLNVCGCCGEVPFARVEDSLARIKVSGCRGIVCAVCFNLSNARRFSPPKARANSHDRRKGGNNRGLLRDEKRLESDDRRSLARESGKPCDKRGKRHAFLRGRFTACAVAITPLLYPISSLNITAWSTADGSDRPVQGVVVGIGCVIVRVGCG